MPLITIEPAATILKNQLDGLQVEYGRLDTIGEFDFAICGAVVEKRGIEWRAIYSKDFRLGR